jgi:hypothetical protein
MTDKVKYKSPVKVLVLDVLKLHKPNIVEFGKTLCEAQNIESADITVYAVDEKTESLKMIIEGDNIEFDLVKNLIEDNGGAVHSIDKVIVGRRPRLEHPPMRTKTEQVSV